MPDISELFETIACKECGEFPGGNDDFFVKTPRGIFCAPCVQENGTDGEKKFVNVVSAAEPAPGFIYEMPTLN